MFHLFPFFLKCLKASGVYTAVLWAWASAGADRTRRPMKGKEDKFSRQQFICVCVLVAPSSVLQISQLCEELRGRESTLSAPISSLRFVPPISMTHTHTHARTNLLPLRSLHLICLSLRLCLPSFFTVSSPAFPTLSPETRSSLSTLLSLFKFETSQQNKWCSSTVPQKRPPVILLGNRHRWCFLGGGFHFLSMDVDNR